MSIPKLSAQNAKYFRLGFMPDVFREGAQEKSLLDIHIQETTEEVSSHPGETGHASQKKHRNTPGAREKSRANQKKNLPICGAGRESQKRPALVVGWKPYGKFQIILKGA